MFTKQNPKHAPHSALAVNPMAITPTDGSDDNDFMVVNNATSSWAKNPANPAYSQLNGQDQLAMNLAPNQDGHHSGTNLAFARDRISMNPALARNGKDHVDGNPVFTEDSQGIFANGATHVAVMLVRKARDGFVRLLRAVTSNTGGFNSATLPVAA